MTCCSQRTRFFFGIDRSQIKHGKAQKCPCKQECVVFDGKIFEITRRDMDRHQIARLLETGQISQPLDAPGYRRYDFIENPQVKLCEPFKHCSDPYWRGTEPPPNFAFIFESRFV